MSAPQQLRTPEGFINKNPGGTTTNGGSTLATIPNNTLLYLAVDAAADVNVELPSARINAGQPLFVNADASAAAGGDIIIGPNVASGDTLTGGPITVSSGSVETYLFVASGTNWTAIQLA